MSLREYVHFGKRKYNPDEFFKVKNSDFGTKPRGGYWGCPLDSTMQWTTFIENYVNCESPVIFQTVFRLRDDAKLLTVRSTKKLAKLPINKKSKSYKIDSDLVISEKVYLDFEAISQEYDAMLVYMEDEKSNYAKSLLKESMQHKLDGWDVDSILVFNKDVIEILEEKAIQ